MHYRPPEQRTFLVELPNLMTYLKSDLSVLDVGCGPGTITLDVAAQVAPGTEKSQTHDLQ
jgi:ubiquinone/menaquinone biosynthesis C-methylase UbiE